MYLEKKSSSKMIIAINSIHIQSLYILAHLKYLNFWVICGLRNEEMENFYDHLRQHLTILSPGVKYRTKIIGIALGSGQTLLHVLGLLRLVDLYSFRQNISKSYLC